MPVLERGGFITWESVRQGRIRVQKNDERIKQG